MLNVDIPTKVTEEHAVTQHRSEKNLHVEAAEAASGARPTLMNRLRTPHRSRRGFTLIELAIALTLLASVFIGLNRYALGGLQAASTNIEIADLRRQIAYARTLLEADLAQARACDPSGRGTPLLVLDTESAIKRIAVYTTATARGEAELVEWRFYPNGEVFRMSAVAGLAGALCDATIPIGLNEAGGLSEDLESFTQATGEQPQLELIAAARNVFNVEMVGKLHFVGSGGEVVYEEKGSTQPCIGWDQTLCYADRIDISFVLLTSGFEPIPTRIDWSFDVNLANAKM